MSWHDSDEVDSDDECEAYNMLYYEKEKDITLQHDTSSFEDLTSNLQLDCEIIPNKTNQFEDSKSNLQLDCEEEDPYNGVIIISDSDDSVIEKKIICTNKVSGLFIGSNSDDSDISEYEQINNNMTEISTSSFVLNMSINPKDIVPNSNFNTSPVQKKDTIEIPDWSVDNIDMQPKAKCRNRYFKENDNGNCSICLKKGHGSLECTRSGPVCILCGKEGHLSNECDDIICHICFKTDHLTKKCPSTSQFLKSSCNRCGQRGHNDQICPDIWRQYKYTLLPGVPVVQRCSSQNKNHVFCANCSRIGHFTDQCSRNRMASRFIGPPPIMEIIRYEDVDIYKCNGLKYKNNAPNKVTKSVTKTPEEVNSMIMDMDVTGIMNDADQPDGTGNESFEVESKRMDFGDAFIMLSPIVKSKQSNNKRKSQPHIDPTPIQCSTPAPKRNSNTPVKINGEVIDTNMPILPESVLRKLFPEETQNLGKLTPALRAKLRKKLKKFLKNGYLPGDSQITQDRMDFWLQEISTGRSLSYSEKKNLLGSVSAALHSISDRVSDVTTASPVVVAGGGEEAAEENVGGVEEGDNDMEVVTSVPESRRRRNKAARQKKSLQNELKMLQRDLSCGAEVSVDLTNESEGKPKKKQKRRRSTISARALRSKRYRMGITTEVEATV